MILSDRDLKYYLQKNWIKIEPFSREIIRENGIDLRIGTQFARLNKTDKVFEIGKNLADFYTITHSNDFIVLPHEHILMTTMEYIELPNDVMAFVNLRSTFARLGLFIPPTIVDAGFKGQLTIEIVGSEFPIMLKSGTRFLHLIFAKTLTPVENPYHGKYQNQENVTLPKFENRQES
jgi:deoxycytidine triphosphate deaminase